MCLQGDGHPCCGVALPGGVRQHLMTSRCHQNHRTGRQQVVILKTQGMWGPARQDRARASRMLNLVLLPCRSQPLGKTRAPSQSSCAPPHSHSNTGTALPMRPKPSRGTAPKSGWRKVAWLCSPRMNRAMSGLPPHCEALGPPMGKGKERPGLRSSPVPSHPCPGSRFCRALLCRTQPQARIPALGSRRDSYRSTSLPSPGRRSRPIRELKRVSLLWLQVLGLMGNPPHPGSPWPGRNGEEPQTCQSTRKRSLGHGSRRQKLESKPRWPRESRSL